MKEVIEKNIIKVNKFIREKRSGLSIILLFFILLISSLILGNIFLVGFYPYPVFFIILVFILSQYFEFEYKFLIGLALVLMLFCVFFALMDNYPLVESFGTYVYMFLILGGIVYLLDNLKEKLRKKGLNRLYRTSFFCILIVILILSIVIFIKDFKNDVDYTIYTKNLIVKSADVIKDKYLRTFSKEVYYSKKDFVVIDGIKVDENIIIHVDSPKKDSYISGNLSIEGWAIERNSTYGNGIDRIEFFLSGKPGEGRYLGKVLQDYGADIDFEVETIKYIKNLYINFYNRQPTSNELSFWSINLENNILSYSDVAISIIDKYNFINRSLLNEEYLSALYRGLHNRDVDDEGFTYWTEKLETDLNRETLLYYIVNSEEFKKRSENYYEDISIKNFDLDIIRIGVSKKYGKQFYLSGFNFTFDSTKFKNGNYLLYIYVHSPIFGWDYEVINVNIEN